MDDTLTSRPPWRSIAAAGPAAATTGDDGRLHLAETDIRRIAARRGPRLPLPLIVMRQAWCEFAARWRGVCFRQSDNGAACAAYAALAVEQFAGINARQAWANWRTIPRNLNHRMPLRPLRILDLCCGIGDSTQVLACYAPAGSAITGLERNPVFVAAARRRAYRDAAGNGADVTFGEQSVLDPFLDAAGTRIAAASVDLVNACGAVGCHFTAPATAQLVDEIARVLRPRGLALIDSGPAGTASGRLMAIAAQRGLHAVHAARSCIFDRSTQVCLQRLGPDGRS